MKTSVCGLVFALVGGAVGVLSGCFDVDNACATAGLCPEEAGPLEAGLLETGTPDALDGSSVDGSVLDSGAETTGSGNPCASSESVTCTSSDASDGSMEEAASANSSDAALPDAVAHDAYMDAGSEVVTTIDAGVGDSASTVDACATQAVQCANSHAIEACGADGTWGAPTTCPTRCAGGVCLKATALGPGSSASGDCALLSDGSTYCWGFNAEGQLGAGTGSSTVPVLVAGLSDVSALAAGGASNCALLTGGVASCWGGNSEGELGLGSASSSPGAPSPVHGLSGVTAIAVGQSFSCALASGSALCWGGNIAGQLGRGSTSPSSPIASQVVALPTTSTQGIAAGAFHACALLATGSINCWGYNGFGQLGNGSTTDSSSPVFVVGGLGNAAAIAAGGEHSCAVLHGDGSVWCWGSNAFGQLGNSSTMDSSSPVPVTGLLGATAVALGGEHSCAIVTGGSVSCWGQGTAGQLGNGAMTNASAPVSVSLPAAAIAVASGLNHSCALLSTGAVSCWGGNGNGELGDGTTVGSSTPVAVTW